VVVNTGEGKHTITQNNDEDDRSYDFTMDHDAGAVRYEDEDGCDLFFEAHESLSKIVSELPYPPTSTRKAGRSRNVTVDLPGSLLNQGASRRRISGTLKSVDSCDIFSIEEDEDEVDERRISVSTAILTKSLTESQCENNMFGGGYPGELSPEELRACLAFRQRLRDHPDPTYHAMVYLNVDVDMNGDGNRKNGGPEEESFALCRFLRARQFDVDETFAMMDEHLDLFRESLTKNDLHRSQEKIEKHVNCPLPVFSKIFAMVDHGLAANGAFVVYLKAGQIRLASGFDCLNRTDTPKSFVDRYIPMVWYMTCRVFCEVMSRNQVERQAASERDRRDSGNDFVVLAEAVVVVDLEGLQRELFNKRTMEFIPTIFRVIQCFPEILNRVLIINVPYFFPFVWSVLKNLIDARTARKIGFYSTLASAQKDLLELVDPSQILSDFGGNADNPTFDEALAQKLDRDGNYDRYIFERYWSKTATKNRSGGNPSVHTLQTFSLTETETADLTVYTQAKLDIGADGKTKSGTKFLLLRDKDDSSSSPHSTTTKAKSGGHGSRRRTARYGQPAATSKKHSTVSGPGKFRLVVKTSDAKTVIERALLVVSIR